ncbi:MAG: hypothetical protein HQ478_16470 [Chloroflexi bacterium]|nr:hypothetical protein [Chloroflexota bacterium]
MNTMQSDGIHDDDAVQAEPRLSLPELLTFCLPVPFDGFVFFEEQPTPVLAA